ncbi:uncharacterized protein LOC133700079 [Populus nigra]|uniref:uncharacterized protein LOC133700079 n=1 Tax=Populus nigra TaxID=3691 RepID=UPI002B27814C|nr:uncharacterized protein LOC133700079 [Populus nigra]
MENEERAHLRSHYQNELESVKNEVAHMTNLLEQLLKAKNGEGTSTQPIMGAPAAHIQGTSQNLGVDSTAEQHFVPITSIPPSQAPFTVDLTTDGPPDNRSTDNVNYDKLSALEERLRAVEDSLAGSALSWYMRLDNVKIKKWKDLVEAFLKQYKFNLEIAPDRTSLMSMEKRSQKLQGIKAGRIAEPLEKKGFIGRKREGDINNLKGEYKGNNVNYQNPQMHTPHSTNISFAKPFQTNRTNYQPNNYQRPNTKYPSEQLPPLPMPLKDLYAKLLSIGQIAPILLPPIEPPFPIWYKPELTCEYHAGNPGHGIETCYAFKRRLLELIKMGWVSFEDMPNVNSNPLPKHAASGVSMVEVGNRSKGFKISMKKLHGMLVQSGFLKMNNKHNLKGSDYYEFHEKKGHHINDCMEFRKKIEKMMIMGEPRIEAMENGDEIRMIEGQDKLSEVCRVQPTAYGPPKLILVKPSYTKRNHNAMPYNYGYASNVGTPLPLFQTEVSGLTRSGRCFTLEELRKEKGKEVVDLGKELEVNKPVTEEESNEFLKLIKHSEYCIVDQLKKTPARISLMSLILSSEPHRNALQKLDAKGTGHNKPLYITTRCKDCLIGKVLVDNGLTLNVLPKHMLKEMSVDESHMKPSTMMARAYDGSPRQIIGTLEYIMNGMLVIVKAEETVSMIKNVVIPFIEAEDCNDEYSHAFEIVNIDWHNSITKNPERVNLIMMKCANQRFGLGYEPKKEDHRWAAGRTRERRMVRIQGREPEEEELEIPPLRVSFPKAANVMQPDKDSESLGQKLSTMDINTLEKDKEEGSGMNMVSGVKDESLPQLTVHTLEEVSTTTFVRKLAMGEKFQNWAHEVSQILSLSSSPPFALMRSCIFQMLSIYMHIYTRHLPLSRIPESGSSTTSHTLNIKNEWPNFNEHVIAVEEEEWDESNIRELAKLVEQHEQIWKPAIEELETINMFFLGLTRICLVLNANIVVHKIPLEEGCKPVKQKLRRAHPDVWIKVKAKLEKQWNAGFLEVVKYPQWVSNIVVVPKKEGKIRVCVDFRNLNKASPKDDFSLPHIDVLVDNAARSSTYSFIDGFSGYNQIKMALEDKAKTTFVTPWGTYCYKVMPFGLKNAGATYQRAMVTLFHDMMHKEIEVYVDDMIAKSKKGEDHIKVLRKLSERLGKYELKFNPAKCSFGVKSGKLLGFMVSDRGIEVDPDKVRAIRPMPSPKTEKEVRGFLGRLNYIARFIAQLTTTYEPIFRLLRKKNPGTWNEKLTEAAMGCVLGQHDETRRKERAIYYLSKKFTECESRYMVIEKLCCALVWATKRLRHYMLYHTTWLISKVDPLRKAVKGNPIADHLADNTVEDYEPLDFDFPDENVLSIEEEEGKTNWWTMFFDGAVNVYGNGAGAVIISPDKKQYPVAVKLHFECSNNTAEYEACILGLEATLELKIEKIDVYGDSMLIICQVKREWQTKEEKLRPYQEYLSTLAEEFKEIRFTHLGREGNHFANALATLAAMATIDLGRKEYPAGASEMDKKTLRRLARDFYLDGEILYKRSFDGTLLRCLNETDARMRTLTRATPYSLVYRMEAVMPLEVEIPSLRVLIDSELEEAEWAKVRYEQLNMISEKRVTAICHHQLYQKRMAKAYDKKVRPRMFQEGDLVLKKLLALPGENLSKWAPNYEGPYVVKKAFSGGALQLSRMDGEDPARPVNSDSIKRYYV